MFIAIAAMLFSVSAFAQQTTETQQAKPEMPTVEQIAKRKADRLKKQLLLGQDQYAEVYKLCLAQAEKDVERMKAWKAEKDAMAAQMKGILNDAQYERFEQLQNMPHPQFHQRPGRRYEPCNNPAAYQKGGRYHKGECDKAECGKAECDKCDKCDNEKKRCDKAEACAESKCDAAVEAKAASNKVEIGKGIRLRHPAADRRKNKNAYIYDDKVRDEE